MNNKKIATLLMGFVCGLGLMFAQNAPCPWAVLGGVDLSHLTCDGQTKSKEWNKNVYEYLLEQLEAPLFVMANKYKSNASLKNHVSSYYLREYLDYLYDDMGSGFSDIYRFNHDPNRAYILFVNLEKMRSKRISLGEEYKGKVSYLPFHEIVIEGNMTLYNLHEQNENSNYHDEGLYVFRCTHQGRKEVVRQIPFSFTYVPETPTEEDGKRPNWMAAVQSFCKSDYISNTTKELLRVCGEIIQVSKMDNKNQKAQEVFINLGLSTRMRKGDGFDVYLGDSHIGRIVVSEVISEHRSSCKVRSGGDRILEALNQGIKVLIKSDIAE